MRWQLALDLKLLIPLTAQWGESQNFKSTGHDNNTKCLLSECKQFHGCMLHRTRDLKLWNSPHCTVRGINNFKSRASCLPIQERPRLQDYAHRQRTIAFPMWLESDLEQFFELILKVIGRWLVSIFRSEWGVIRGDWRWLATIRL